MSEDTKVAYQTIGKLGGLNVLFDPDYTSRPLNLELNGVTLQEALDLVAAESKTFWKPMTANRIFVAADSPAKRKELEENVVNENGLPGRDSGLHHEYWLEQRVA